MDFVRGAAPAGVVVPFGFPTTTGIIAFQLRPGIVRETTFTGALESLLDEGLYIWSIRALVEAVDFQTWRPRIERITSFDLRLERPNPHYHGNDIAEQILEDLRLEYSRLIGSERNGEGVDDESPLFQQALDHVLRDYGRASVRGMDEQGAESLWVKLRGRIGSVTSRRRIDWTGGDLSRLCHGSIGCCAVGACGGAA